MKNIMKKTHEQFLEDLLNKNEHYRDGEFEVIGQYITYSRKILIRNKYGTCAVASGSLLQGVKPHIMSAVNQNEYFINMCIEKFGEDDINDLNQLDYVNSVTKIKVIDRDYGEYFIRPPDYLNGKRNAKRGHKNTTDKKRFNKQYIEDKIKEMHPELKFILDEYIGLKKCINVSNKYGVCGVSIESLLAGNTPTIVSAVNPTDYFINQAREVHGDKYDYSLVEYKNNTTKVKIKGPNGIFKQAPRHHLLGHGCPIEGRKMISNYQRDNPNGWTYTNWEVCAKRSKNFTGYKVYFLECWDKNEIFYKIGRTYKNVGDRFRHKTSMPYQYNILYTIELDDPKRICEIEQEYKNKHSEFKYIPSKKFGGMHECFSQLIFF